MSNEKKPRKRLKKLVSGVKEKLKRAKRAPRVKAEPVSVSTPALSLEEKPIAETIRHRAAIAGYVTDAHTGQTISGALVELAGQNLQTETRADGFYYFLDLPAGQYEVNVTIPRLKIVYGTTSVASVDVKNDPAGRPLFDTKANIGIKSTTLVGQVKRSDNDQPIEKAKVELRGSAARASTDREGRYALFGLQKGEPTVRVSAAGYEPISQKVTLIAGQETTANFNLNKT
jgi:hypothetical protein